jgi:hypothetical protein
MAKKLNCWEFHKCGRQPGGERVHELGACPAAAETRLEGIHGGSGAGRCCWMVAGTFCKGKPQGTMAMKFHDCTKCEFYKLVKSEEGRNYIFVSELADKLK